MFFCPTLIAPAIDRDFVPPASPGPGARAAIGGDIGLVHDASAFVAVHRLGDVLTVAELLELRPRKGEPLKLSEVVHQGCLFALRHGQKTVHVDHHVLEPAREHLIGGVRLVPVEGGQEPKAERYLKTREKLRQGLMRIPGSGPLHAPGCSARRRDG